ncbi:hypothetical protein [Pseudomonas sp. F(2018)]|uniref:hypothetical protein n=1 Tax=Pseudomonas sp. F(2018) TaxID=2502240 RepID=UPI0010F6BC0C|nr:hypothetical protein [Pseudomonas sp. F(2018)]
MGLERIWKRESRSRQKSKLRIERSKRNWPIHAELVAAVFDDFAELARHGGVGMTVQKPGDDGYSSDRLLGQEAVILSFHFQPTGHGFIEETESGPRMTVDIEHGAQLVVHHSSADGVVQVFLEPPQLESDQARGEQSKELLIDYTYNTDDLTRRWVEKQIARFLVFNRVESLLLDPSRLEKAKVRLWRFLEVRNRRGYLDNFHHVLTPWQLVVIAAVMAVVGIVK